MTWQAVYCSSSIANFKDKLARKFGLPEWHFLKSAMKPAAFFGMYNPVDYLRFMWHRGERTVFWCGSDILNLQHRPIWRWILRLWNAEHICENHIEYAVLKTMGIESEIKPCLVDKVEPQPIRYKQSKRVHAYMCAHDSNPEDYGVITAIRVAIDNPWMTLHVYGMSEPRTFENIIFHGQVPHEQFVQEINNYQVALRLNEFDGFSEVLAHAMLRGQYAISRISYPFMFYAYDKEGVVYWLKRVQNMREANTDGRTYWTKKLMEF